MTCRDFERLWTTHSSGELSAAAQDHLSSCPHCAALVRADSASDAWLCQFRAARFAIGLDLPRDAIDRALEERSGSRWTADWRSPLVLAATGLAAAAVVAALMARAPRSGPAPVPPGLATVPPAHPGGRSRSPQAVGPFGSHDPGPRRPRVAWVTPPPGPRRGWWHPTPAPAPNTDYRGPSLPSPGIRTARQDAAGSDLLRLNDGRLATAVPYSAPPELGSPPQPLPPVETRRPGSVVLDDLLSLNPVRVAAVGDTGLSAAAQTLASEAPATDARLQQHVFVHATREKISDVLAGLSKATGVSLVPRVEVAGEPVSLWEEDRPLMDVMRDLRHLHGWFWSRSKQGDQYVYSLWQDAQSRAREDAELQRLAMEQHRQFEESIWKHVRALHAADEELKKLGRDDPYLIAQMLHPVVKNAWALFSALSPDQQALLTRGQTPNTGGPWGMLLQLFPPPDDPYPPHPWELHFAIPKGDIVRLTWEEMSAEQRHAVEAIMSGGAHWTGLPGRRIPNDRALAAADSKTAVVSLYRCGDPAMAEGLGLYIQFQSGGKPYALYSNFAVPPFVEKSYGDSLRKGESRLWQGAQEAVSQFLGGTPAASDNVIAAGPALQAAAASAPPDPVLDAPLSFTWTLPLREDAYSLGGPEVTAALQHQIGRPLIADESWHGLEQKRAEGARFRWEKRPLRELLQRFFPGWEMEVDQGAIFLRNPDRLKERARQLPPAVEEFLDQRAGALTLDDMALLARSLTPREVTRLQRYLPLESMDQLLAAQELLKLYGELAPAQRTQLARGLPFTALTPPQQRLFLQFAQRQRPYVELWRLQQGGVSLAHQPPPPHNPRDEHWIPPLARMLFQVRFQEGDTQPFPVDLYAAQEQRWNRHASTMIGKPFPFPTRHGWSRGAYDDGPTVWEPALGDARLRKRTLVILVAWPWAEPYTGRQPAPAPGAWARALAARLQDAGVTVAHVALGSKEMTAEPGASPSSPNLIRLVEPGDETGAPFHPNREGNFIMHWPIAVVVGRDEIVRAVFDGPEAWDMAAIERAARAAR